MNANNPSDGRTERLTPSGQAPVALRLVVVAGPSFGQELRVAEGTYRIGKDEGCELVIADKAISRVHLVVSALGDALRIVDNQSTNGSFCEGAKFNIIEARAGTTVRIGRSALRVLPLSAEPEGGHKRIERLVGRSAAMVDLTAKLAKAAKSDAPVLLSGETGTGKDVCAHALHDLSDRAAGPFVICDLASVSSQLIESDLFGHVKGAFTGALTDRAGVFESGKGGTVFLDEIGEMPLDLQPRLLRVLEQKEVRRVGGNAVIPVDVRIVAATHKDLAAEVAAKRFREDLYFRLAVVSLTVPPLRERPEDVSPLVDDILARMGLAPSLISSATRERFRSYRWPGNVRELRNVVERVVNLGEELEVTAPEGKPIGRAPFKEAKEELIAGFERDYLAELYRACEGNISRASREAGIDRVHLRKLFRKYGFVKDSDA